MIKITGISSTILKIQKELEDKKSLAMKKELANTVKALHDATPKDTGFAADGWYATENTIENDVPYIDRLNEGSSQQAPAHFVEQTIINNRNLIVRGTIVREK